MNSKAHKDRQESLVVEIVKSCWKVKNDEGLIYSLADLVVRSFSVTAIRAVSVGCADLKLDWLESRRVFWER